MTIHAAVGLRRDHALVLSIIRDDPEIGNADIASLSGLDLGNVTGAVQWLRNNEYLNPHEIGIRSRILTPKGLFLFQQ